MSENDSNELTNTEVFTKLRNVIKDSIEELKVEFSRHISQLTTQLESAEAKIKQLNEENKILLKQQNELRREIKKNNLIIFGLKETENEDLFKEVQSLIRDYINVNLDKNEINQIYRFGKGRNICLKLVSFNKKIEIIKQAYLLKDSGISIAHELSEEDREAQKILRKHMKDARNQNKEATIKNNKLIVDNISFTVQELQKIEKDTHSRNPITETKTNTKYPSSSSENTDTQTTKDAEAIGHYSKETKPKTYHRTDTNKETASGNSANTTSIQARISTRRNKRTII